MKNGVDIERPYHLSRLSDELAKKQRRNAAYSMRSFAKWLEMSPGNLSQILSGKRGFPKSKIDFAVEKLQLDPIESSYFERSILNGRHVLKGVYQNNSKVLDNKKHYDIISQYEHFAILSLIGTKGFQSSSRWIAKRLGLSLSCIESAIEKLISAGFIEKNKLGKLSRSTPQLDTTVDIPSSALKKAHQEALELGIDKLAEIKVDQRHYATETIGVNVKNLPKAKKLMEVFRKEMGELLENGQKTEVYHLCMQLYPITIPQGEKNEKL